jgi:hypothetical protein
MTTRTGPAFDELVTFDTEPCETCDTGIATMTCFDGIRRCRTCVTIYASVMGWNQR